jgi:hypothetical protein
MASSFLPSTGPTCSRSSGYTIRIKSIHTIRFCLVVFSDPRMVKFRSSFLIAQELPFQVFTSPTAKPGVSSVAS